MQRMRDLMADYKKAMGGGGSSSALMLMMMQQTTTPKTGKGAKKEQQIDTSSQKTKNQKEKMTEPTVTGASGMSELDL